MQKHWLMTGAVITAFAAPLSAQTFQHRATITGSGNNDRGKCTIEVVVDGAADIEIRGDTATLRNLSGQMPQWRRFECTGHMPANAVDSEPNDLGWSRGCSLGISRVLLRMNKLSAQSPKRQTIKIVSPAGSCQDSMLLAPLCAPTQTRMAVRITFVTNAMATPARMRMMRRPIAKE